MTADIERTGTSRTAREIPETVSAGIMQDTIKASSALSLGATFRMPSSKHRIRVLKAMAEAFWIHGETRAVKDKARKSKTGLEWDNVYVEPEEIAVLVQLDDAWVEDSDIAWPEIQRAVAGAFAKKIDAAIFFGEGDLPENMTGPAGGIVGGAVAVGNYTLLGSTLDTHGGNDLALDLATVAEELSIDGYDTNGFTAMKGFPWRLVKMRDANGQPIYAPPAPGQPATIFGQPFHEVSSGVWDNELALALAGEWDKLVIGIRRDMTFEVFDQAVLTDGNGLVTYSAVEQDGKVARATMRLGYAVPNPVKDLGGEFPFGILAPASLHS